MARELFTSMTKAQAAFHRIRGAIEEGRLKPGERLRATALQKELGMSPTPIREALRLLQAQGLVEHRPHHGMVVAEYTVEETEEVYGYAWFSSPWRRGWPRSAPAPSS